MGCFIQATLKHQLFCVTFKKKVNMFIDLNIFYVKEYIFSYVLLKNLCGKVTVLAFKKLGNFFLIAIAVVLALFTASLLCFLCHSPGFYP